MAEIQAESWVVLDIMKWEVQRSFQKW